MAFDYGETALDVLESLQEFGAVATFTWTPPPTSSDPEAIPPAPVTVSAYGVLLDYNFRQIGTQSDSLIRAGDKNLLMAVIDVGGAAVPDIPPQCECLGADGVTYILMDCKPLAPAGVAVMLDIQLRR